MTTPPAPPTRADDADPAVERATPAPSRGLVVVGVAVAVLIAAWAVWAGLGNSDAVHADVRAYDVRSDRAIEVTVVIAAPGRDPGTRVGCAVQALDEHREVVGVTTASARLGQGRSARERVVIRTRGTAVTAVVDSCQVAGQ